jgi:two-component system, chemotaxis family, protein-glutamate methylesterase/glutaminase
MGDTHPNLDILVVDDSATFRMILSRAVRGNSHVNLAGTANDGEAALAFLQKNPQIGLVLLDVSMPILDGLETLRRLRRDHPGIEAVMLSGLDKSQTGLTMQALSLGALDFVPKPQGDNPGESFQQLQDALYPLFSVAIERRRNRIRRAEPPQRPTAPIPAPPLDPRRPSISSAPPLRTTPLEPRKPASQGPIEPVALPRATPAAPVRAIPHAIPSTIDIVALGVSTGGPNALQAVIPQLPANLPVPIVVVQHMPPLFTASLAERLARDSKIKVVEAQEGMILAPGTMYLAPGGKHMVLQKVENRIKTHLIDTPPVNSCRPSVDVLFQSVEELYGGKVLSVILTGMGSDGANAVASLRAKGAYSLVQDEATSVVWGMPGAVANAGNADEILPLPSIAGKITQILQERSRRS